MFTLSVLKWHQPVDQIIKMNRRKERERIVQLIYQLNITGDSALPARDKLDLSEFQTNILDCFVENRLTIDKKIRESLKDWRFETIGKVDLACLQMAVSEMLYVDSIPSKVSINEAIEMAKLFGEDDTPKFVNGVLRTISDDLGI